MTITSSAHAARETARRPDGRFGVQDRPESGLNLIPAPPQERVTIRDARGMPVRITPGILDAESEHLYTNGQCLALAVALAEAKGWGVAVHTYDEEGLIAHAYAVDPKGTLHDIHGDHDEDSITEHFDDDEWVEHYRPDELDLARQNFAEKIGPQDYELATTFIPAIDAQLEKLYDHIC